MGYRQWNKDTVLEGACRSHLQNVIIMQLHPRVWLNSDELARVKNTSAAGKVQRLAGIHLDRTAVLSLQGDSAR